MDKIQLAYKFYLEKLLPYTWIFEYSNGIINELRFKEEDLPHLTGIDKLNKYSIMKSKNIRGISSICLHDLKSCIITDQTINSDKHRRLIERRVIHFDKLSDMLDDPNTLHYIFDKELVPCSIPAEYMLYNPINNIHCHLGIIETRLTKGSIPKKYSPITWFIEKDRPDMYIKNQKALILKSINKIK